MKPALLLLNALGFLLMFLDKRFAVAHRRRIPEKTLLLTAILGGSLGCILGMELCRHKTKHKKFRYGLPLILLLQAVIYFALQ